MKSDVFDSNEGFWKSVLGTVGFTTGVYFWSLEILIDDIYKSIMIGVTGKLSVTKTRYASYAGCDSYNGGLSYNLNNGNMIFQSNVSSAFDPSFSNGDVIGTLLDMNHKTITFYKNGVRNNQLRKRSIEKMQQSYKIYTRWYNEFGKGNFR